MSSKEPTKEQQQKFWEWCGFKYVEADNEAWNFKPTYGDAVTVFGSMWVDPSGYHAECKLPPIDLNNLFKYAEGAALKRIQNNYNKRHTGCHLTETGARQDLFELWMFKIQEGLAHEKALFWAIWEVINEQ